MRRLEPQHGGHRRGGAVERPVEPAEGDHAGARPRPGRTRPPAPRSSRPSAAASASDQNTTTLAADDEQQAPDHRPLAQPGGLVLQLVQPPAAGGEAVDRPAGQAEQPQLLGRRRVDGQPVGVVGVALGRAHLVGVAVAPDRRSRAAASGWPARPRRAASGAHQAKPNSTTAEARPPSSSTRPPAMKSIEIDSGGPVMPRSKSRATVRSLAEARVLEVAHARRAARRPRSAGRRARRRSGRRGWRRPPGGAARAPGAARTPRRRRPAARPGRRPPCTAPTSTPMATANTAGSSPASDQHHPPGHGQAPGRPWAGRRRTSTPGAAAAGSASDQPSRRRPRPPRWGGPLAHRVPSPPRRSPTVLQSLTRQPPPTQGDTTSAGRNHRPGGDVQPAARPLSRPPSTRRPHAPTPLAPRRRPGPRRLWRRSPWSPSGRPVRGPATGERGRWC